MRMFNSRFDLAHAFALVKLGWCSAQKCVPSAKSSLARVVQYVVFDYGIIVLERSATFFV